MKVQIIEARDRLGGRVDDIKWTERIAKGAMVINGTQNNPFATLTQQLGQTMHILGSSSRIHYALNNLFRSTL